MGKALIEEHFHKVTVIVRPHNMENGQPHPYAWSPLAYSAADCVATQWEKTDADGNKTMINENQELLNDWRSAQYLSGDAKAIATFHFFQKAFKILRRFDDSEENQECAIVGSTKDEIVVAKKYRTVWVVMQAPIVKDKKDAVIPKHHWRTLQRAKQCLTLLMRKNCNWSDWLNAVCLGECRGFTASESCAQFLYLVILLLLIMYYFFGVDKY